MSTPLLPQGCYLVTFILRGEDGDDEKFAGTIRVEHRGQSIKASGDLYRHSKSVKKDNIPIFPRAEYAFYLAGINITPDGAGLENVQLEFKRLLFEPPSHADGVPSFLSDGKFSCTLRRLT